MKRLILLAFIALAVSVLQAAPARLPYVPEKMPEPHAQFDLRGTTWEGRCFNMPCVITFHPNGMLSYRDNTDSNAYPGVWHMAGDQLVFEINQFSEHRGPVLGDGVQGESSNKAGMRDKFQLRRVPPGQ